MKGLSLLDDSTVNHDMFVRAEHSATAKGENCAYSPTLNFNTNDPFLKETVFSICLQMMWVLLFMKGLSLLDDSTVNHDAFSAMVRVTRHIHFVMLESN